MKIRIALLSAVAVASAPVPASASVSFSGTRVNVDGPGPAAARCGSRNTGNIRNAPPTATSSGISNLGNFIPTLSHCIQLPLSTVAPTPFDLGEFLFAFDNGDTMIGTYSGQVTFGSPGLFNIFQTHLVTGGTGAFAGASGSFTSSGTLTFPGGRPTVQQSFSGLLNLPAIPEPGTWAMMLMGFLAVGVSMRRQRRASVLPALA